MEHVNPKTFPVAICAALVLGANPQSNLHSAESPARMIRVTQDGADPWSGKDHRPLQAAIDAVVKQGGGEIVVGPGEYLIGESLRLKDASLVTLRGEPGAVLRLPPLPYGKVTASAAVGTPAPAVEGAERFAPDMKIHFLAPGKVDSFSKKSQPFVRAMVQRVEEGRLVLDAPLEYPLPLGTLVHPERGPNVFTLSGACEDIILDGFTLEGGRGETDPRISGHVIGCGVLAEGRYKYESGPLGPPVRRLTVRDCTIRHCYGRGVAMYSAADCTVERCTIEDTVDEAIDFDHFAVNCRAIDNRVVRCGVGVEMNDANDCLVEGNRFEGCGAGINLWRWCHQPELNVRNRILNNLFLQTKGSAVLIRANTASNVIEGNEIRGSGGSGVVLEGANQTLVNNRISGTKKDAMSVQGTGHIIRDNTVVE